MGAGQAGTMIDTLRKVLDLLTPRERRRLWLVFAAVLVAALLETAGVASVIPFLTVVGNPNAVLDNALLRWLFLLDLVFAPGSG